MWCLPVFFFFYCSAAPPDLHLSLHDALPICRDRERQERGRPAHEGDRRRAVLARRAQQEVHRSEEHTSELQSLRHLVCRLLLEKKNKSMNCPHVVQTIMIGSSTQCSTREISH